LRLFELLLSGRRIFFLDIKVLFNVFTVFNQ
jgi:hypothetical protein